MKNYRVLFFLIIFIICAASGMLAANRLIEGGILEQNTRQVTRQPEMNPSGQNTVVVVRVDDLELEKPSLISVWVAFIGPEELPSVSMVALYPNASTSELATRLAQAYYVQTNHTLPARFWTALQAFNFTWDGYFLLDEEGLYASAGWLVPNVPRKHAVPPINPELALMLIGQEAEFYETICASLALQPEQHGPKPDWNSLIPSHMRTDLSLEYTALIWQRISNPAAPPDCNIMGNP
jgi:hypothetical protein